MTNQERLDYIEDVGTRYREILSEHFYHWDETTGRVVIIERGKVGYRKMPVNALAQSREEADWLNECIGHSEAEVKAAVMCSMFGGWVDWDQKIALIESGEWDV